MQLKCDPLVSVSGGGWMGMPLTGAQQGVRARLQQECVETFTAAVRRVRERKGPRRIAAAQKCKLCVIALIFMFPSDAEPEARAPCGAHYHTSFE